MGISLGLVGLGAFGSCFADLFKRHPLVSRIALCDREPERMARFARDEAWRDKFHPRDAYASFEDILASDLDALVIITQPWLHAPQCVQALERGKHVYSAVPVLWVPDGREILENCERIIEACRGTGRRYMLGETTYYRAESMFCRRMAVACRFGDFVYAEGEYMHDVDDGCNLRNVVALREASAAGREWVARKRSYRERGALDGPMHYPTHSVSGPVCVMKAHAVSVTAHGWRNRNRDGFFDGSAFSNETALFRMSNGATVRICEFRECAGAFHESETFRVMGTAGSFAEGVWRENGRSAPGTAQPLTSRRLTTEEMRDPLPADVLAAWSGTSRESVDYGGHGGSHAYLVHEFVEAVATGRQPAINAWEAARYTAMGAMAHESALKDGESLKVPDWGDAPA